MDYSRAIFKQQKKLIKELKGYLDVNKQHTDVLKEIKANITVINDQKRQAMEIKQLELQKMLQIVEELYAMDKLGVAQGRHYKESQAIDLNELRSSIKEHQRFVDKTLEEYYKEAPNSENLGKRNSQFKRISFDGSAIAASLKKEASQSLNGIENDIKEQKSGTEIPQSDETTSLWIPEESKPSGNTVSRSIFGTIIAILQLCIVIPLMLYTSYLNDDLKFYLYVGLVTMHFADLFLCFCYRLRKRSMFFLSILEICIVFMPQPAWTSLICVIGIFVIMSLICRNWVRTLPMYHFFFKELPSK